jgi:hypothetical protein
MEDNQAQLAWERKFGRLAAAAAFLSSLFLVVNTIIVQALVLADRPTTDRGVLLAIDQEAGAFLVSGVVQGLNYLALGVVLWYLFQAARHRRKELPPWAIWLVYIGPIMFAVASLLSAIDRVDVAEQFAASGIVEGAQGERRAEALLEERPVVPVALGAAGTLALAFSLVLVNLHAMRAGLLSRFLGIIGMIVGALYVLPLFGGPLIVQVFWLGALGAVFLGFWPGGRGEAWETGRPGVWLSAAEQRRQAVRAAAGGGDDGADGEDDALQGSRLPEPEDPPTPRKRRKKRKG